MRAALLTFLTAVLLAGCVRTSVTSSGTARHSWTVPHVLRIANIADPDALNPVVGNQQIEVDLSLFWAGYLLNWDDHNQFVPELAADVPTLANGGISRDGKTIVYHLRKGVHWQDGAPFGADDVIFTYRAIMNPNDNVSSRTGYELITHIDKRDDATIAVHLKRPWAPFVASFLTFSGTPYPVLPAHLLAKYPDINHVSYNQHPIGTGPFRVVEWQHGTLVRMEANPTYWRGPPRLRQVVYHIITDSNTILTQLRTHEIDLDFQAARSQIRQMREIDGDRVDLVPFNAFYQLAFNVTTPILADVRVRQALALATDRKVLIDNVTHGVQTFGEGDQPPGLGWSNDALHAWPYDPERAKRMLDAAGWHAGAGGIRARAGRRLSIGVAITAALAEDVATVVQLQRQWRQIGVDVIVKPYVTSLYFEPYAAGGILQTGKYDAALYTWFSGIDPDDSTLFMCDQFPPAGQNTYHFCDPSLDAAERRALGSYDPAVRQRAYDDIQSMLVDKLPFLNMWFVRRVNVYNVDLQNFKPAHAGVEIWNPWEIDI